MMSNNLRLTIIGALSLALLVGAAAGQDAPQRVKHQITGMFSPDREADLRETFEKIPQIKLVAIDFKNAEAELEYVPAKVFPGAKPEQVVERLDNLLKSASSHTFGAKPLRTMPRDKLELVEIRVAALDCKACSLAAYEIVYRLDGVELATANFRAGLVTALIDPTKTNRTALEKALQRREVTLRAP